MDFENVLGEEFLSPVFYIAFYSIIFLFGISIGSFLNVVIYRLPKNESLTKRASHCMTCGEKIRIIDLIPVFSWLFLRGKCRKCKEKISPRYLIVETLTGLSFMLVFFVMNINAGALITCVLFALLIVIGFMDWDTMEMDIRILILILLLAVPSHIFTDTLKLSDRIIGAFCVSIPFFLIGELVRVYMKKKKDTDIRGIELGDTLLMLCAGGILGPKATVVSAFAGIFTAAIGGSIRKWITGDSKFAFGPFLAVGVAVGTLWGNVIAEKYLSMLKYRQ